MVVCGREPDRGKKTDRLREWIRECRRVCFGGGFEADMGTEDEVEESGADKDEYIGEEPGKVWVDAEAEAGKEEASGEGSGGEKGLDTERVRGWEWE
jgi:hypothetical protein